MIEIYFITEGTLQSENDSFTVYDSYFCSTMLFSNIGGSGCPVYSAITRCPLPQLLGGLQRWRSATLDARLGSL